DRLHALLAGEDRAAVHAHPTRAADHHPATLAIGERAVDLVLDQVEDVEQARPLGRVDLVGLEAPLAGLAVDPPDLDRDLHRPGFGMDCGFGHPLTSKRRGCLRSGRRTVAPPSWSVRSRRARTRTCPTSWDPATTR